MPYFKIFPPTPPLQTIIRELQVYHVKWQEEKPRTRPFITCLANTEQNLYFYINDATKEVSAEKVEISVPGVVMTGPKYKPVGLVFGDDHLMIKVAFHPTGTHRLLGINMQQTVNNGIDATEWWGEEIKDILQQLRRCSSYDSMIRLVCTFLEKKYDVNCRPLEPIDDVAIQMLNPLNDHSQEEWAAMACLSLRQFERNFISRVGISPKLFIRIVRFEYAMKLKNHAAEKSWAEIAMDCGYTDSSHLLKEFKEFAEFPPSKFYLNPTSGHSEHPTG